MLTLEAGADGLDRQERVVLSQEPHDVLVQGRGCGSRSPVSEPLERFAFQLSHPLSRNPIATAKFFQCQRGRMPSHPPQEDEPLSLIRNQRGDQRGQERFRGRIVGLDTGRKPQRTGQELGDERLHLDQTLPMEAIAFGQLARRDQQQLSQALNSGCRDRARGNVRQTKVSHGNVGGIGGVQFARQDGEGVIRE